jgi:hypothetical protein
MVTNPIFLEDELSFLAKEKINDFGDKPAFKYTYENSMPAERLQDESTIKKGAKRGGERGVEGEVNEVKEEERDIGETRSHDLVKSTIEPIPIPIPTRKSPYD